MQQLMHKQGIRTCNYRTILRVCNAQSAAVSSCIMMPVAIRDLLKPRVHHALIDLESLCCRYQPELEDPKFVGTADV